MGSVPYYLHLSRIPSTNSFSSPRCSASRQNRRTPCAREPYWTPGIFPATSTNRHPRCLVATATTPSRPQSPCPSHISCQDRLRMDSAVDTISRQSVLPQRRHPSSDQLRSGIRTPHDTRPSLIFLGQPQSFDPHRIQVKVPPEFLQPPLILDQRRLESSLKHVAPPSMRPVEPNGIAGLQPPNRLADVRSPTTQQQMVGGDWGQVCPFDN